MSSSSSSTHEQPITEEVWLTTDGANVFDNLACFHHQDEGDQRNEGRFVACRFPWRKHPEREPIRYRTYAVEGSMTPLDIAYQPPAGNETDDEFYDGTGTLVWLAAKALVWMLEDDTEGLRTEHLRARPRSGTNPSGASGQCPATRIVCELGCGTGLPGLAALLLSGEDDGTRVVFTDNDLEALENCRSNCVLNGITAHRYSHFLLGWGEEDEDRIAALPPVGRGDPNEKPECLETEPTTRGPPLRPAFGSVHTVLAADVLYDVKMIPPLFQTASRLLVSPSGDLGSDDRSDGPNRDHPGSGENPTMDWNQEEGGIMILSHVPRFCLPRHDDSDSYDDDNNSKSNTAANNSEPVDAARPAVRSPTQPFEDLEDHIVREARKVGLRLINSVRPHHALAPEARESAVVENESSSSILSSLDRLESMHAVVFVFRKEGRTVA